MILLICVFVFLFGMLVFLAYIYIFIYSVGIVFMDFPCFFFPWMIMIMNFKWIWLVFEFGFVGRFPIRHFVVQVSFLPKQRHSVVCTCLHPKTAWDPQAYRETFFQDVQINSTESSQTSNCSTSFILILQQFTISICIYIYITVLLVLFSWYTLASKTPPWIPKISDIEPKTVDWSQRSPCVLNKSLPTMQR